MDGQQIEKCVKSCCLGDRQAYEKLINAHYSYIYLLCLSILTNARDADQVAQETFLQAYKDLGKLKIPSNFSSWINQIARNLCINLLRNKKSTGLLLKELPERKEDVVRFDDLQLAIKRLPDQLRMTLFLYFFDGKNVGTISGKTQQSSSEVYSQLRNAGRLLGKLLSEDGSKITTPCPDMLNRILNLALAHSSIDERKSIEIHTSSCQNCRKYQQQIIQQMQRIDSLCPYAQDDISGGCEKTIEALNRLPVSDRPKYKQPWNKSILFKALSVSAAAVVIVAASLLAIKYLPGIIKSKSPEVVQQQNETIKVTEPEKPVPEKTDQDLMLEQFKKANAFYADSNSDQLVRLLQSKYAPIRMIVAKFLSEVGNERALAPLNVLSDQWQGTGQENNPYLQAIESITLRYADNQPQEIFIENDIIPETTAVMVPLPDNTVTDKPDVTAADDSIRAITFTGRVVDPEDQPVMSAVVTAKAMGMNDPEKWLSGLTDLNGNFTLIAPDSLKEMKFPIAVWAVIPDNPDFVAWTLINILPDTIKNLPQKIPGNPGTTKDTSTCKTGVSNIKLIMTPAAAVSGLVTDPLNNPIPMAEVKVQFSIADKSSALKIPASFTWPVTVLSDDQGFYIAGNLPKLWANCIFEITASAQGYISDMSQLKTTGALEQEEINLQLILPGPTVTGILFDNYGTPLPERQVIAFLNNQDVKSSVETKTDNTGKFILENCPPGPDLAVMAKLSANSTGSPDYVFYPDAIVPIEYHSDQFEYDIELTAVLPELTFEVLVTDTEDNPVPDFTVQLKDAAGVISTQWQKQFIKTTDESGTCIFTQVPELEGIEVILDTRTPGNSSADSRYKNTKLSVNLVPGQNEYFIRAILYTDDELKEPDIEEGF